MGTGTVKRSAMSNRSIVLFSRQWNESFKRVYDRTDISWQLLGNCSGMDPSNFELPEKHTRADRERVQKSTNFCVNCPVFRECDMNATESDREWTVRAGRAPLRVTYKLGAPPTPEQNAKRVETWMKKNNGHCKNGHVIYDTSKELRLKPRTTPYGFRTEVICVQCLRDREERSRNKRNAAKIEA